MVGILGGMAFEPYFKTDNTLLSQLNHISPQDFPAPRTEAKRRKIPRIEFREQRTICYSVCCA